ncbi:DUF2505 domain-containing protein [Nocardioides montaniterrae]
MQLTRSLAYDAPVTTVLAMLHEPEFWDRVAVATRALSSATTVVAGEGGAVEVVTDQQQAVAGVPAFAKRIVGDSTRAIITAAWDGPQATYVVDTPGKPTSIKGTVTVVPEGEGSVVRYELDVSASVPVVSGKLERLISDLTSAGIDQEHEVGRAWLAEARSAETEPAESVATEAATPAVAPAPPASMAAPAKPAKPAKRGRVRTVLDVDQTIAKLDATTDRLNDTLDTFGALLVDFTAALTEFNTSVRGFNGTVGEFDGVVDKADGLLARADLLLGPLGSAQLLGDQLKAAGAAAGSVAANAVRKGVAVGKGLTPGS